MKSITIFLLALICILCPVNASAQTKPINAYVGHQILIRLVLRYHGYDTEFDTDGQSVGGLDEADLKKKFTRVGSAAAVINFMAQNGYKTTGFSSTQAGTGRGDGGGFNGYVLLFEQIN